MRIRITLVLIFAVLLSACGGAAPTPIPTPTVVPTPVPGVLWVDPEQELGPVSPYIFGSNYGPWTAVPAGQMDYALNSHVTVLRWPGGEWGDVNDVREYQVDQFLSFCEQIGAIPTISVRLLNGTPEAAAELVRYVNQEQDYGVVYWSIGNEPDLYDGRPNVEYDTVRFNQEWRAIAEAMLDVDRDIQLIGPELHGTYSSNFETNPKDNAGRDWMTEFLLANGDLVDIVSYHRYPFPLQMTGPNATIAELRRDTPEWTATVRYLRALIHTTTGRDLPIAVTEAGSHYTRAVGGEATPDSFFNAIWWADVLGRLIDEGVFMVNQWVLTSTSSQGGLGMIYTTGPRPIYYVYQMYQYFGTRRVYAASAIAEVSIYAALRADGALTVMVVNLSDSEQRLPLQVSGWTPAEAEVWLFDASHNAEGLGLQPLPADGLLVLPGQSLTLYVIAP
ncbi:MAG: hypothetical protein JXB85_00145 [Anaerolineales bacterium]|nr:hypothetical protein [Anaerolineales bacterium]